MAALAGSAVVALICAVRNGQFAHMREGAEVIFDKDEPIGQPTDTVWKSRKAMRRQCNPVATEKI